MYKLYKYLTVFLEPIIWLYLRHRLKKGKEDPMRFRERFGYASMPRPRGKLIWIHAASVGESLSVLPLIERLCVRYPEHHILLTTVTVTSANLVASRLPIRALHHYLPVDALRPVRRFLKYWKPDAALWVESELWPNLLMETHATKTPMLLINARISDKSYEQWKRYKTLAQQLLPCFDCVLAQTERVQQRFQKLGAPRVEYVGNLKYDAPKLPFAADQLDLLKRAIGSRKIWVAASTHPGEEAMIIATHYALKKQFPDILTFIAPRHPKEGDTIRALAGQHAVQRSRKEIILPNTEFYIADTLGELGLFFSLSRIVFMGGSLVQRGGHNPLEPVRMGSAVITAPYIHHFTEMFEELDSTGGLVRVADQPGLVKAVTELLQNPAQLEALVEGGRKAVDAHAGVLEHVLNILATYLRGKR